ncbi:MAG: phosphoglycerate mutase family protein [Gammaproteobacteria bacterium]|nr:phosphoglycerate mutase family protein [Gammaproteobacteria bacterium]
MNITLLRHGKPEFELAGNVRACDLSDFARSYDLSGITGNPPSEVIDLTKKHKIVVCSDLPRSLQSAKALGVAEVHSASSVFTETSIPHFDNGSIKLPISLWVLLLRSLWYVGFSRNGESLSAAKNRAKLAAQELISLAKQFDKVLLVGHGLINYFIAKELLSNNWLGPSSPGRKYWEYGVYRYSATYAT